MENITFESAKYVTDSMTGKVSGIVVLMNNIETNLPLDPANRHYAEILRQVEAGTLTIAPAEGAE